MSKYRITIITVSGDGVNTTCVYEPTCESMYEAHEKAIKYASFQMNEESGVHIKHISVSLVKEKQ